MTDKVTFTVLGRVTNVEMTNAVQSVVNCLLFLEIVMVNGGESMTAIMMPFFALRNVCKKQSNADK